MPAAEARVSTENPGRYLTRLCQHASKMHSRLRHRPASHADGDVPPDIQHVECSATDATLVLNWGQCTLHASPGMLALRAEAADPDNLTRIQDLIGGRLKKFGRREHLTVTWRPAQAQAPEGPPGQAAGGLCRPVPAGAGHG